MHYTQNPFYILLCSPDDDKNKIHEQAELRSFDIDENLCRQAESILLNPKKRLEAEVSWFLCVKKEKIDYYLSLIENNPAKCIEELSTIVDLNENNIDEYIDNFSKANLLCFALEKVNLKDIKKKEEPLETLCMCVNYMIDDEIKFNIANARDKAGISNNFPDDELEEQLDKQKDYYKKTIYDYLNKIDSDQLVTILTELIKIHTCNGESDCDFELLEYVINKYEEDVGEFFEKQEILIDMDIENIETLLKHPTQTNILNNQYNKLEKKLCLWSKFAKPILIYKRSCGLDDEQSIKLFKKLRNISIIAYNNGYTDFDNKIINICIDIFKNNRTIEEIINKDKVELAKIEKERIEAKKRKKEEEDRISFYSCYFKYKCYDCSIIMDRDSVSLTKTLASLFSMDVADGVDMIISLFDLFNYHKNNTKHFFKNIKMMRWGVYIKKTEYVTYTQRKLIYKIQLMDIFNQIITIQMKEENYFIDIINRLQIKVGKRCMKEFLEKLHSGNFITIGKAKITDYGIELTKLFLSSKFYSWLDLTKKCSEGCLIINGKDGYSISLSFLNDWNTVVLSMMLDIFWKNGRGKETRISSLLSIIQ